jgi:DNA-binding PadR family transcriptional regulator
VAAIYLYVSNQSLHYETLWFALKNSGYSASPASIYYALRRAEDQGFVERSWNGDWRGRSRRLLSEADVARMLGATRRQTRPILDRTRAQLDTALDVSRRRRRGVVW